MSESAESDVDVLLFFKMSGFFVPGVHSRPMGEDDPDIAPGLVPLREKLMALVKRPVNIQASRDIVLQLSGGRIKWRTIQTVPDAGYIDAFRLQNPDEPGFTMPSSDPHVRLDYAFVAGAYGDRILSCDVVSHPDVTKASDHHPVVLDLET